MFEESSEATPPRVISRHAEAIAHLLSRLLDTYVGEENSAFSVAHTLDDEETSRVSPSPIEAPTFATTISEMGGSRSNRGESEAQEKENDNWSSENEVGTSSSSKDSTELLDLVAPTDEELSHDMEPVLERVPDKDRISEIWTSALQALDESKRSMLRSSGGNDSNTPSSLFNSSSLYSHATRLSVPLQDLSQHLTLFDVVEMLVWAVLALFLVRRTWASRKQGWGSPRDMVRALHRCKTDLRAEMVRMECSPLMLRLAWSDCATHDKNAKFWPDCGGAIGAVRFKAELRHESNRGLSKAIKLLEAVKSRHDNVSWADLIQMAGVLAVEITGGPRIRIKYGRVDAPNFHESRNTLSYPVQQLKAEMGGGRGGPAPMGKAKGGKGMFVTQLLYGGQSEGHSSGSDGCPFVAQLARRLPQAIGPYPDGAAVPSVHIRNVFYRMGFDNREIVALCGAHTIGRAFSDRSGVTEHPSGYKGATPYTCATSITAREGSIDQAKGGVGMPGGCSWTRNWLTFDNSYYRNAFISDEKKTYLSSITSSERSEENTSLGGHFLGAMSNPMRRTEDPNARKPVSLNQRLRLRDPQLLWLPTDNALETDPEFKSFFFTYAQDQNAWFRDYAAAHKKMSELGARFSSVATEAGGLYID